MGFHFDLIIGKLDEFMETNVGRIKVIFCFIIIKLIQRRHLNFMSDTTVILIYPIAESVKTEQNKSIF